MHYANIKTADSANGIGVRVTLFVSGCTNHCKGCFQKETWDFNYGEEYTKETEDYIINELSKSYYSGLTILGGEPLEPENQEEICKLVKRVKKELPKIINANPNLNILFIFFIFTNLLYLLFYFHLRGKPS